MTSREVFRAKARQAGVSDASIDLILHHLSPAYDLSDDVTSGGTEVGRLGGDPELPPDVTWDGSRMFLASIDLAALPPHSLDVGLPRDGRLLLFCNAGYELVTTAAPGEFPHAMYLPPGTEAVRREWSTTEYYDEHLNIEPRPLYAKTAWDLPVDEFGNPLWDHEEDTVSDPALAQAIAEYRTLAGHLDPLVIERDAYCIKLGGVAYPEQDRVEEEVIGEIREQQENRARKGLPPHPSEYELRLSTDEEEAAAWTLLADANYSFVFLFGEGSLYWLIPRVDLSQSRFDRVAEVFQV